jgi:xanthine dehydrogenase large subunit
MINIDSIKHARGESLYVDDLPVSEGTLYGLVFDSPVAHGIIKKLDLGKAIEIEGVHCILTYKDIPGQNQIGLIIMDEPLFAENEVHFIGQPIAFIVAESINIAKLARNAIETDIEELEPIVDARIAQQKGHLIMPPRTFRHGDFDTAWRKCDYVFVGTAESGGQEHLYLETQGAYAILVENERIRISSATQGPTAVQKIAARVLNIPMQQVEVDVVRLGGAFGGKEDQATAWAVMAALACWKLKKPVKFCMHRHDDMRMTGKRHPYSSDFKIGLDKNFKILAYKASYYQNAGAAADLSPAIIERTLFHAANAYFIPNIEITAYSCKTNLPPNTAFRGFGAPQGVFVMESAIAKAAEGLGIQASQIQEANLLSENDVFPYGQLAQEAEAKHAWAKADELFCFKEKWSEIERFNQSNVLVKKGAAVMPICFGISFTNTVMNHARALVHIYQDGSVGISTGAVEMGQSVNTKMVQVAASIFQIPADTIKIETTNTTRVANTSPSAASSTADLNGKALESACNKLVERLLQIASGILNRPIELLALNKGFVSDSGLNTQLAWESLIEKAFLMRINLSEMGHYATPTIFFDKTTEKGHPFAYHVYGTASITAQIDCLRGTSKITEVKVVHDFGQSMNTLIDKGQIEGAVIQAIGWSTMEEVVHNQKGQLLSNALSTYKIPDIYSTPACFEIWHLETEGHPMAIQKSKAVGEPPFIYGIGAYFAIQQAIKAYNPNYKMKFDLPATPEKILMGLYSER